MNKRLINSLICTGILLVIWFTPAPSGLKLQAWHLFAIFLATVAGFILQPAPMGVVAMISVVICSLTGTLSLSQALSGFSNSTVWLVVSAFMFARGFVKTGLGRRIAFIVMRRFGDNSLKLAYSLTTANLLLGPVIPSNTARAGGVLFPVVQSLCVVFDSSPGPTARRIGSFLMMAVFQTDLVVCAMFLTSMAANPLMAELAYKTVGVTITWSGWFIAAIVPGIIALLAIPYAIYRLSPPEIKKTPEAKQLADNELAKMGPMSMQEKAMTAIFLLTLTGWIVGGQIPKLNGTTVALLGVSLMLVTDVLVWKDVLSENNAWDNLVWMGTIVALAGFLNSFGFIGWFANNVNAALVGIPWIVAVLAAGVIYLYSHYGFASMTAHVTAMYAALVAVATTAGAPAFLAAFVLAIAASICGCLTHYGTGPAPIFYGAGYVSQAEWWRNGFLMSLLNIAVWFGLGSVWWKVLGLW